MYNILLICIISLFLNGCSLLPRFTFEKPGVTPTQTVKSNKKESCSGEYKVDQNGTIISCSKNYQNSESNYSQKERKFTFQERIANFIRGLAGWSLFLLIGLILLCPGLLGWLVGRVFNVFRTTLTGTVKAIGNFRNSIPTITVNGQEIPDPVYMKAVDALLDELEEQHSKDPNVLKTISDIRLRLKIEDND